MTMSGTREGERTLPLGWWAAVMITVVAGMVFVCSTLFAGTFRRYVPVSLTADRTGLVLEKGAKVRMRGVDVGQVGAIEGGAGPVRLELEIFPDKLSFIPSDVEAEIKATTAFGAKYVELIPPPDPSQERLAAGMTVHSRNVATEVNTVFQNLVGVLDQIDIAKLNATLSALADGVRGRGESIGQATTAASETLRQLNVRVDRMAHGWRSFKGFNDVYGRAAKDILAVLDAATTTADTVETRSIQLDALLLSTIGMANTGTELLGSTKDDFVTAVNEARPTTDLLLKYDPVYTCLLVGAKVYLDMGGYEALGGNGRSLVADTTLLFGDDPYRYPEHLPIHNAKGGPGGNPGCGSLPDVEKNFPVRKLVTDTGLGTGPDIRTNPGIGHPWFVNFFPATRAVPEHPYVLGEGPHAPGPPPSIPHGPVTAPLPAPPVGQSSPPEPATDEPTSRTQSGQP
ncbi:MCE family protein [Mycolicibacterium elephantis]